MMAMSIRPQVRAAAAYRFTARPHLVKLDQNESAYDLPEPLREAALARLRDAAFNRYPDLQAERLREKVAGLEDWPEEGVVVAGGSNVLIQASVIAAGIGRRLLTVAPTFPVYAQQGALLGAAVTEVALADGFSLPEEGLVRELAVGEGVHFITDPMAPTAGAIDAEAIAHLVAAGGDRWLSVIDEAYGPFAGSDHRSLVRRAASAVSLRTMSKAFGLGGVRLGYALARPEVARELQKAVLPFSVSSLQLAVAETVLDDPGYVAARVAEVVGERDRLAQALARLPGVEVFPSVTNFLLLRVADAAWLYEALLAAGVLVRRQDHLAGLGGCLRVTVGAPQENEAFLGALTRVLAEREVSGAPG
jgi:histidinol-phosphate aminotransferase